MSFPSRLRVGTRNEEPGFRPGPRSDFFHYPAEAGLLRKLISKRQHVLVHGPTGCGKTELLERLLGEVCGSDYYHISLSGEVGMDELFGSLRLRGGDTVWQDGPVLRAMRRRRPLLVDELDAATPETLFALQRLLEGKPVTVYSAGAPESHEPLTLDPASDDNGHASAFVVLATANTSGSGDATGLYAGVNLLNESFRDRFWRVELGYPDAQAETEILVRRGGLQRSLAAQLALVAELYRKTGDRPGQLQTTLSVRRTLMWALGTVKLALSVDRAFDLAILQAAAPEDRPLLAECFQRVFGRFPETNGH